MGVANLAHDSHTIRSQDLVKEMREGRLDLGDFLAVVATLIKPCLGQRIGRTCGATGQPFSQGRPDARCQLEGRIRGIDLHRRIRTVADFTGPSSASRQDGGETQPIQLDIFRVL